MNVRLALSLVIALAVAAGVVWFVYSGNQSSLARLEGEILKVRTYPVDAKSVLVIADFRVTNPGSQPFVVDAVELELARPDGVLTGTTMTKREIDQVFAYQKLSGPRYNDPLIVRDRVEAGATVDRMAVAHFEVPETEIDNRSGLRLRVREFDGKVSEIAETQTSNKK